MSNAYKNASEIEAVVHGLESCTTPASGFTHRAHLTVAVWYLSRGTIDQALLQMRASIFRFLDHLQVGREKYHETLTLFWLKLARQYLDELGPNCSLVETTNALIGSLGDSQVVYDYYSKERLWSVEAKQRWIEPDLKGLKAKADDHLRCNV